MGWRTVSWPRPWPWRQPPGPPRPANAAGASYGTPDWFLFRRGQTHAVFEGPINGGRGESEPMVAAAYGPEAAGRAIIAPGAGSQAPFSGLGNPPFWMHMVLQGLDIRHDLMYIRSRPMPEPPPPKAGRTPTGPSGVT